MKELFNILDKYNIKGLKIQSQPSSNNNKSRNEFTSFVKKIGAKQIGITNGFIHNGKMYGFSMPSSDTPECRQFSEHYQGLVCKFPNGDVEWYERNELKIGSVTRISPNGVKYFNVKGMVSV